MAPLPITAPGGGGVQETTTQGECKLGKEAKQTIKAAKAEQKKAPGNPSPQQSQGHLADRHVRTHTPKEKGE